MARYTGASCKLCRRQGEKLFLKGERCVTDRCAVARRPFAPGQHGKAKKKLSDYGLQVAEKQKVKRIYGVLEKQFRIYFKNAARSKGVTGEVLLQILERRIDNVIFRLGFASSRAQARQVVKHNHFIVNGKTVNIPSFLVKQGDIVEIKKTKENMNKLVKVTLEKIADRQVPKWIKRDDQKLTGEIID
ncbi:MAG: 30S ribosomal protein S4, partial [Candidatus Omnitrophica bacterium]|nr:30S ribosomal protein S4 [Candidatus Omnitrophota bacterium]